MDDLIVPIIPEVCTKISDKALVSPNKDPVDPARELVQTEDQNRCISSKTNIEDPTVKESEPKGDEESNDTSNVKETIDVHKGDEESEDICNVKETVDPPKNDEGLKAISVEVPTDDEKSKDISNIDETTEVPKCDEDSKDILNVKETVEDKLEDHQIPEPFTEEELSVHEAMNVRGKQAVQFTRIHCTACNVHLGSAPNQMKDRYIHPLLRVIICKPCYDFYGSGDFVKDEDGSELYCRWCGQGGKVLCCSECPVVFCQKCIRNNLGRRLLNSIIDSDDWKCFACNPSQIIKLRVACRSLYEFGLEQKRLATELESFNELTTDFSLCCTNKMKLIIPKRKRTSSSEETLYDPLIDNEENSYRKKKKMKVNILSCMRQATNENKPPCMQPAAPEVTASAPESTKMWDASTEHEVVCTPDLSMLMEEDEESFAPPTPTPSFHQSIEQPPPLIYTTKIKQFQPANPLLYTTIPFLPCLSTPAPTSTKLNDSEVQFVGQTQVKTIKTLSTAKSSNILSNTLLSHKPIVLNTTTSKPLTVEAIEKTVKPNLIRLQAPAITFSNNVENDNVNNVSVNEVAPPSVLAPGLKYEWFEKATQITAKINQNLSNRISALSKNQNSIKSLEELANLHNSLQEILSNSINSLLQIRKSLRNDFIAGLKTLKFCKVQNNSRLNLNESDVIIVDSPKLYPAKSKLKLINLKRSSIASPITNPCHGFITVKPPSKLMNSSVITIPDDGIQTQHPVVKESVENVQEVDKSTSNDKPVSAPIEDPPLNAELPVPSKESTETDPIETNTSDILEDLNPEIRIQIKNAIIESKLERIVEDNVNFKVPNIPENLYKQMLSVRVVLETDFGSATLKSKPRHGYKAMNFVRLQKNDKQQKEVKKVEKQLQLQQQQTNFDEEEDIEKIISGSIVVKTFDNGFSNFTARKNGNNEALKSQLAVRLNKKECKNINNVRGTKEIAYNSCAATKTGIDVGGI